MGHHLDHPLDPMVHLLDRVGDPHVLLVNHPPDHQHHHLDQPPDLPLHYLANLQLLPLALLRPPLAQKIHHQHHLGYRAPSAPVLLLARHVHSMGPLDLYLGANHARSRLVVRAHHLHHLLATKHDLPLHHPSNHSIHLGHQHVDLLEHLLSNPLHVLLHAKMVLLETLDAMVELPFEH